MDTNRDGVIDANVMSNKIIIYMLRRPLVDKKTVEFNVGQVDAHQVASTKARQKGKIVTTA